MSTAINPDLLTIPITLIRVKVEVQSTKASLTYSIKKIEDLIGTRMTGLADLGKVEGALNLTNPLTNMEEMAIIPMSLK